MTKGTGNFPGQYLVASTRLGCTKAALQLRRFFLQPLTTSQAPSFDLRLMGCSHSNMRRLIPGPLVGSRQADAHLSAYLDGQMASSTLIQSSRNSVCNMLCVREIREDEELILSECGRVSQTTPQHLCYLARIIPDSKVGTLHRCTRGSVADGWELSQCSQSQATLFQIPVAAWPMSRSSFNANEACSSRTGTLKWHREIWRPERDPAEEVISAPAAICS